MKKNILLVSFLISVIVNSATAGEVNRAQFTSQVENREHR